MALRTVYGNTIGENGWPMVDEGSCQWVIVPGTDVNLEIQTGWPLAILRAWAADFNAYVEPLRDADSACWTATNSVATSNHLSGTACDLNWNSHPFQIVNAGFTSQQINTIRDLLAFYEDTIWWGNDWNSPKDVMHFQVGYDTYNNPHTGDFIARKIRADGYSTYRRGATPSVLTVPLTDNGDGTWTSPSPAWAHLIARESSGNPTIIQQIIDVNSGGNEAEGLFQIAKSTWRAHNGTEFAATPRLATPQQQALVAARIFTRNPSGSDWGAGLAGRENAAELAAGLVPATAPPEEDFLSALSPDEQRQLFNEICGPRASRSPLRHVGEGTIGDIEDLTLNTDGSVHTLLIYLLACVLGDPDAIALLREVAGVNLARYPDRVHDSRLAQAMLNVIDGRGTASSAPITGQTPGMTPITVPPPPPPVPPKPVTVPPVAVPPTPVAVPPGGGVSSNVAQLETDVSALRQVLADLTNQIRS